MSDRYELNKNLAQMLKGGVIMDVTTPEQAKIAQEAGACAVMALERIPADIRAAGGVATPADAALMMQLGSFFACSSFGDEQGVPMTFIRAPYIKSVQADTQVLSTVDGKIVAARQKKQPMRCGVISHNPSAVYYLFICFIRQFEFACIGKAAFCFAA